MAVITSPLLDGARGRIDGVVVRHVNGQTIMSARPRDRRHRRMNASQQAQTSAFRLASELCNLMPLWARRAYVRVGARSSWNIAMSTVVRAITASTTPVDALPRFSTLLAVLASAGAETSRGVAVDISAPVADGVLTFTAPVAGRLLIFAVSDASRFPTVSYHDVAAASALTVGVAGSFMWLFLDADGQPATSYAADCIHIS